MELLEAAPADVVLMPLSSAHTDLILFRRALCQSHPTLPFLLMLPDDERIRREITDRGAVVEGHDQVLSGPLDNDRLFAALRQAVLLRASPTPSLVEPVLPPAGADTPDVTLAARTILFTDMRGSTEFLESSTTQSFFKSLNYLLNQQALAVRQHAGTLVKFTGDGIMASFNGLDRLLHAFHCARQIQELLNPSELPTPLTFGQGICDGLVVCGYIGEHVLLGKDTFGRPAHLAARLCSHAAAGTILMRKMDFDRIPCHDIRCGPVVSLKLKGVKEPMECVQIDAPS